MKKLNSAIMKIKGADGEYISLQALRGATSYEVAVQNGYKGSEDEWVSMMVDDGWITKYQELEANKANKKDVYTGEQVDELLAPVMKDVENIRKDRYPLWELSVLDKANVPIGSYSFAISPNRQYVCNYTGLYKTDDLSRITEFNIGNNGHVIMDNDMILLYDTSSSKYKCYRYDENGAVEVTLASSPNGQLNIDCRIYLNECTPGKNLWFWSKVGTGSANTDSVVLYKLDKELLTCTSMKTVPYDIVHPWSGVYRAYSDGDDCIVLYMPYSGIGGVESKCQLHLERITSDGGVITLFSHTGYSALGYSSYPWYYTKCLAYDPKTENVVLGFEDTYHYYDVIYILSSNGDTLYTTNFSGATPSDYSNRFGAYSLGSEGSKLSDSSFRFAGDVIDSVICTNYSFLDLETLEVIPYIPYIFDGGYPFVTSYDASSTDNSINGVYPINLSNDLVIYNSNCVLYKEKARLQIGGWKYE